MELREPAAAYLPLQFPCTDTSVLSLWPALQADTRTPKPATASHAHTPCMHPSMVTRPCGKPMRAFGKFRPCPDTAAADWTYGYMSYVSNTSQSHAGLSGL